MAVVFTRRRVVAGLIVLLVAGALAAAIGMRLARKAAEARESPDKAPPVTLEFAPADLAYVAARPMSRWLAVSGTLQPERQATVKAKVVGEVRELSLREGERVQKGQVVARIDTADLEAKLAERVGALESARAHLALATKTRAMNVKLLNERFISQNAFDSSESGFDVAQGNVKSAEAQVKLAQNALKDAVAAAPLSGVVAKRHVQQGEKVNFDSPLVTIVDLTDLEVQVLVPAIDVPGLALGMPVELAVDGYGDRRFKGRVGRINPSTEPGTRAILVYVALPNPDATLRSGMFATGRIGLAAAPAERTLPASAIRAEAGETFVWTIDGGKLVRRPVLVGRRDDDAGVVELRTALPPGLPVLAARFDNLKDGAPAIVRATPASGPASRPG
jgi:membrane fusion protein (multidrug efflux system)